MNNRDKNIMLLKKAAAGKLSMEDLHFNDEPKFDICLDLTGGGGCKSKYTDKEIQRLKAKGQWYDVTLNVS